MISPTASRTDSGAATSSRSCAATASGVVSASIRLQRMQPLQQRVERLRLELVRDWIRDQPGGAVGDLLPHDEPVLAQRGTRGRQVDDPLDQSGQGRELDRPLDLDDLRLAPGVEEVAGG